VLKTHVTLQDEDSSTSLFKACENGSIETATVLLDHGADINYLDKVKYQ
jgi:ankyrin repeat protein